MNTKVYPLPQAKTHPHSSRKATVFEFTSWKFEPHKKRILFNYKTEFSNGSPLFFTETIVLPKAPNIEKLPDDLVKRVLDSVHIILGISYYKFYCATKVRLPYQLSKKQAQFWNTVYKKGLGEFFYRNHLDPKISPNFPYHKNYNLQPIQYKLKNRGLLGIGGGKDSIVAAELLKKTNIPIDAFLVQTNQGSDIPKKIIELTGLSHITVQRLLDWQVTKEHQYNGHIPISGVIAFLGMLAAVLYDYSYVIVGNEHSSNFGNLRYKGIEINHQWSKSFEFESLFHEYIRTIIEGATYFSLLRNFYEIRIVKMFAKHKKYFSYFASCNSNFKIVSTGPIGKDNPINLGRTKWCGKCAKCVFVFTLLSAFLSKKELLRMFGKNLYQDKDLLPLFKNVVGFGIAKPFDCVGTFEEVQTAMHMARKKYGNDFIMRQIGHKVTFDSEVFRTAKESNIPEPFKFLGMETVLVLGYGKEGRATKQYLKKYYPTLEVSVADRARDSHYLEKQRNFDIAVKTPGINKELVTIPYTTATNIFFCNVTSKNIIGVTGSKGKSTTTSLIYHILKTAKKDVKILGNIGKPMLGALTTGQSIHPKSYVVLELSSYQLDDIQFSPHVAVVTNLFKEHMDFHGNLKRYYQAKKNIIKYQKPNDYFVYDPKNRLVTTWLSESKGHAVAYSKDIFENQLLGRHNQRNIQAAIATARILGIPDAIIKKALASFKPLPHRLEFVGTFKGIHFYDDAISTTPDSTIMALKAIPNVDTIFLGGQDRKYNFNALEKAVKKYKIRNVVLFPDSGKRMLKSTKGLKVLKTRTMKDAVTFAYRYTKKGSVCLLSCASPSYSLWENFEEKGNQFKKFVKQLGKK